MEKKGRNERVEGRKEMEWGEGKKEKKETGKKKVKEKEREEIY